MFQSKAPEMAPEVRHSSTFEVGDLYDRVQRLGLEVSDITGSLEDVTLFFSSIASLLGTVRAMTDDVAGAVRTIDQSSHSSTRIVSDAAGKAKESERIVASALARISALASTVGLTQDTLEGVSSSLGNVASVSKSIRGVAKQTHLLSLNATIEAARAGPAGLGFSVVASEVKELAKHAGGLTSSIDENLDRLYSNFKVLLRTAAEALQSAGEANASVSVIDTAVCSLTGSFAHIEGAFQEILTSSGETARRCAAVNSEMDRLSQEMDRTIRNLQATEARLVAVDDETDRLVHALSQSGANETDRRYIGLAIECAERVGLVFERAVASGEIALDGLFDDAYEPIPGTDPQEFRSRILPVTERWLPELQEPLLDRDPGIVFAAAIDRNGYVPTHNRKFSHPQGRDPEWNNANCRSRRIFKDRATQKAVGSTSSFLLKCFRRKLSAERTELMYDVSAPILVRGRRWGAFRIGYRR